MKGCAYRKSCREQFRNMNIFPLRSQYIYSLLMFVVKNIKVFDTNRDCYEINTRHNMDILMSQVNLAKYGNGVIHMAVWEPPTTIQTSILLGQQTPRGERRHNSYTATHGKPTQTLANQRLQLQLRLQLARTQPSGNGIKYGPQQAKVSQSTSTTPLSTRGRHTSSSKTSRASRSAVSSAAPLSAGVRHGSSPHWRGQQLYAP
jgi:hypothetical protein